MSNKIIQRDIVKGAMVCDNEIKTSQFANDINLICAVIPSVENALQILVDVGKISGLALNEEKIKAMWLGRSANNKADKPLILFKPLGGIFVMIEMCHPSTFQSKQYAGRLML